MKTTIFIVMLLGAFLSSCITTKNLDPAYAVESVEDDRSFRMWFSFYYVNKDSRQMVQAIKYMGTNGFLSEHPDISAAFLSFVFADNEQQLTRWMSQLDSLPAKDWDTILAALWLSNNKKARKIMASHIERSAPERRGDFKLMASQTNDVDILNMEIATPNQVNLLWASFSATGDPKYVDRVISLVSAYEGDSMSMESVIGEAAIVTLANNTMQHEVVAKACLRANNEHPNPKTRVLINAMLSAITEMENEGSLAH